MAVQIVYLNDEEKARIAELRGHIRTTDNEICNLEMKKRTAQKMLEDVLDNAASRDLDYRINNDRRRQYSLELSNDDAVVVILKRSSSH